jgi:hypothetical protein
MSLYQEEATTSQWTFLSSTWAIIFVHGSKKLTPKASHFEWAINLARPCPFTNFVGLISIPYSSKVAIHLALLPSGSAYVKMSLIVAEGTKTVE